MSQDTGKFRTNSLDQYYTRPSVAEECIRRLKELYPDPTRWIEPSAGSGVFLVEGATGYDIDPKDSRVQRADFLTLELPENCVVYGNPPFGRQASLAKAFIRHASEKADAIAFILPRSFTKPSMQSAFPRTFHLVHEWILPPNSFEVNEEPYDVPCVFQIWSKKESLRPLPPVCVPSGFQFGSYDAPYDLVFRRVGVNAGRCSLPGSTYSPQSHYFVKLDRPEIAPKIVDASRTHEFPTNTTGPRSLSKGEATEFLNKFS